MKAIAGPRSASPPLWTAASPILVGVLDRSRYVLLSWAAACFALFALLALAVSGGWGPLSGLDDRGEPLAADAVDVDWLDAPLRLVETALGTIGMTVLTVVLAVAMFARGHRRAAAYTVVVMGLAALATTGLKLLVARERPDWQTEAGSLTSNAFPSGHASSTAAYATVCVVLAIMLVRRLGTRRLVYAAAAVLVVVAGLDRVLLGRHYATDVVAGVLLGVGVGLLVLALYSPLPRSHAVKAEPLPEAIPTQRCLAVVLNPIKVEDEGAFRHTVSVMAAEAGWSEPTWHLTTIEDPGDGTVREVCAELAGTGIPVGIVPAGTGNLLARNLGIPLYLRAAIDVALTGQDRAIDMVAVEGDGIEGTHFMVMAGMGFDAAIMEGVNEDIKKRVGWLAYVLSGLKSLMFPSMKVEVSVDGADFTTHRARTVVVGNVGFLQAGMPLLPDATIDDGQLDVVILHPRNFFAWIPLAWRVLLKRKHTDELVDRKTGASVVVRTKEETPRQLDGDSIGPGRELRMECIHGRLLVRVPR